MIEMIAAAAEVADAAEVAEAGAEIAEAATAYAETNGLSLDIAEADKPIALGSENSISLDDAFKNMTKEADTLDDGAVDSASESTTESVQKKTTNIQKIDGIKYRCDDSGNPYAIYNAETKRYELRPNNEYTLNGYTYKTDKRGRIVEAKGELHLKEERPRKTINEEIKDMAENDDKSHLFADMFDGGNDVGNLVPMDKFLNRQEYKNLETQLSNALKEGKKVNADIKVKYNDKSGRPDKITVSYSIDGVKSKAVFKNTPGGNR